MPFTVAIVGRPNVGKSTLFNRYAGRRRALVEDQPGVGQVVAHETLTVVAESVEDLLGGMDRRGAAGRPAPLSRADQSVCRSTRRPCRESAKRSALPSEPPA